MGRRKHKSKADHAERARRRRPDRSLRRARSAGGRGRFLRGVLIFGSIVAAFYVLYNIPAVRSAAFDRNLRWQASAAGAALRAGGYAAQVQDRTLRSPRFSVEVYRGCDGAEPTVLFIAAVLASPVRWTARLRGIVLGVLILQALNVIRIISLFMVGVHIPSIFDAMHIYVWQAAFIVMAVALWALWAARTVSAEERVSTPHGAT